MNSDLSPSLAPATSAGGEAPSSQDEAWGVRTSFRQNEDGGLVVTREQLVADHVDYCKARANEGLHGFPDFKLKASIPVVVVEHYCSVNQISLREFVRNPEHAKRIVNDPAFADLRIAPGRM